VGGKERTGSPAEMRRAAPDKAAAKRRTRAQPGLRHVAAGLEGSDAHPLGRGRKTAPSRASAMSACRIEDPTQRQ